MTDILSQLERATEGSREISDGVLLVCGWKHRQSDFSEVWEAPDGKRYDYEDSPGLKVRPFPDRPDPSRNLQDAVSLVPEGREWSVTYLWEGRCGATCGRYHADFKGETPALALCIAIIKASKAEAA